MNVLKEI